ncbi:uncharacterized protein [Solanum tuberosum]|uniref:uncharacterized protein n=1 Tax=Solanum tuberosum TaxID=4113 RepID=UPI00073A3989|nr:PREDICTED: retrovirus-related Pol polyprotein from transposon TNT 1-94 [Solanum tuberosum]
MDVKLAFLHGDLDEENYMEQPEGFEVKGKENYVCKLKKSLYGLKQAPRQWYMKFGSLMSQQGFKKTSSDHCVFVQKISDARQILGMQIVRDRDAKKLWLSQEKYIQKVLCRFNMDNAKVVNTPLAMHFKLSTRHCPSSDGEKEDMKKVLYASVVGSLMYAMVCIRPDIAHAVSIVSRFLSNPGREHWNVVKWIMRYLCGTSSLSLCFGTGKPILCGSTNSDMAGDVDTQAKLIAAVEACKELIWMKRFLGELGCA